MDKNQIPSWPIRHLADQAYALGKEYKDVSEEVSYVLSGISDLLHDLARKVEDNGTF